MQIRDKVSADLKTAMKAKDTARLSTLRLINAAIKDREIAARANDGADLNEADQVALLAKMVKQRHESAKVYDEGGRVELADKERAEIGIIEHYLPKQLSEDEITAAIDEAIGSTGASSLRDMGKVMGHLKSAYTGQMDFGAVGALIKARLAG